jgi:hypothetical protein
MKFSLLLTVYKRSYLEKQLEAIYNQTIKPDYLIVFQNENHVSIEYLKKKYNFIHVKSDYNTKYFGRFSYCLNLPVDICIIMDDDIIPAKNCFKNYVNQCIKLNGIIGGNGRPIDKSSENMKNFDLNYSETGIRVSKKVDFVGHLWCFKKDWLYYMFSIKPFTFDTGEDMHLCFSSKIRGNIDSYVAEHKNMDEICDSAHNLYAGDEFASYKYTPKELRLSIPKYFIENFNLVPITY